MEASEKQKQRVQLQLSAQTLLCQQTSHGNVGRSSQYTQIRAPAMQLTSTRYERPDEDLIWS